MTPQEYVDECNALIGKIKSLERFDYSGARFLTKEFSRVGNNSSNPYATEELGKIEVSFEQSKEAPLSKKLKYWEDGIDYLIENIEIFINTPPDDKL